MEMWFTQLVGGVACLVGISAFWQKDDLRFRYQMMAFCFVMSLHFALMGAAVAATGVAINGVRSFASAKTRSRVVMWFFIALMWAMTISNISHIFELMAVVGSTVATWALFTLNGIVLRSLILFNSSCWLAHNLWLGSIGGTIVESAFIITNILTIYRLYSSQQATQSPSQVS
ncbi:YgjV family protein [Enterovibrio sp. ZSDZ42]|uniref:YgjV family protein n=1 Tax=Enterovibrio gelatinilyticus TaxID=2899819 RepID=A0ABT5R5E8_9GAMM|nr:YgjV family protein [Enterovibrio sp. ZSDZ42]MDD1795496.1 YgjV family protein [Enterovibrio sp. ZSDZ42]